MNRIVVIAEKPSVAMDIAGVLGCGERRDGFVEGNGYVVTWALGHLVGIAQPHEMNPQWKAWEPGLLPMVPARWNLSVLNGDAKRQLDVIAQLLNAAETSGVVCATDAGREGELIFRNIYELAGCSKPVRRLWISSLTAEAIRKGLASLRPGGDYDGLAAAARGRAQADWLVGMNLTRLYTLALGSSPDSEVVSVGRVQTPTLAMIVERDAAIERFVAERYGEWEAKFVAESGGEYVGRYVRPDAWGAVAGEAEGVEDGDEERDGSRSASPFRVAVDAKADVRWKGSTGVIERVQEQERKEGAPLLFDLTELQRVANRVFGFSAQRTLDVAQALYEKKAMSYPRTDSRFLTKDAAETMREVTRAVRGRYEGLVAEGTGIQALRERFVNDGRVSDHHAIIPTPRVVGTAELSGDEAKIYDLVCRRLLQCWHGDYVSAVTTVLTWTSASNVEGRDLWVSRGVVVLSEGWRVLEVRSGEKGRSGVESALPAGLARNVRVRVEDVTLRRKKTRPPGRFTEALLLTAMESAGRTVSDEKVSEAMRERGLGTPATRAGIIETLVARRYVVRQGKYLGATERGRQLIERVDGEVRSAEMTGQWEAYLKEIERGGGSESVFMAAIEKFVSRVVESVKEAKRAGRLEEIAAVRVLPVGRAGAGGRSRSGRGSGGRR
jgi:DNA topoisomerase-3